MSNDEASKPQLFIRYTFQPVELVQDKKLTLAGSLDYYESGFGRKYLPISDDAQGLHRLQVKLRYRPVLARLVT